MLSWLKDKTIGSLQRWLSEKIARMYQELHTERLQRMAKRKGVVQTLTSLQTQRAANSL